MRRMVLAMVPLLVFGPALWGADDPKDKAKDDPNKEKPTAVEQYKALMAEFGKAQQELTQRYGQAKTDAERAKIVEEFRRKPREFVGRFFELAKKNPKAKFAFDGLSFVVTNGGDDAMGREAISSLLKDHADKVKTLVPRLRDAEGAAAPVFLRAVLKESSDHDTQGQAAFTLAQVLNGQADSPTLKKGEAEKLYKEAEELLVKVTKDYADVGELAKDAEAGLFEVRHLAIGKKAPEIEGDDVDSQKFRLSDYQGKVVVLDFWGHW